MLCVDLKKHDVATILIKIKEMEKSIFLSHFCGLLSILLHLLTLHSFDVGIQ